MSSPSTRPAPEGLGSVAGAPHLPDGFTATFTSQYINTAGLRQHVVTGGQGPPLLLVHGWPQTWYAWRLVMPALARDFTVIAPDQRGTGLSSKPADGYDTATLAADLAALMDTLGHRRFAVAGHDTGMWIGYALAADHPGRVTRLAVAEAAMPGVSPHRLCSATPRPTTGCGTSRSTGSPRSTTSSTKDANTSTSASSSPRPPRPCPITPSATTSTPSSPTRPRCTPASPPTALDATIAQNQQRKTRRLTLPVLAIGRAEGIGEGAATTMKLAADNVQSVVIPGSGHYCLEETPQEMLATLTAFLAPYQDGPGGRNGLPAVQRARQ